MKTLSTDVLIIGSGFGGAAPALRFSKAGFKTTVIEKGPDINPYTSFRQTQDPKYLLKYFRNVTATRLNLQFIEALGGGSGFYEMISLRAPSLVFDIKNDKGINEWPEKLSRRFFDKYYDKAETALNVEQAGEHEIPKTGHVFIKLMKQCNYSVERTRYALTNCQNSGYCISGCVYGAKQSLFMNYLPEAKKFGATIYTEMDAFAIKPIRVSTAENDSFPYKYWVLCKDKRSKNELIYYKTKILILGAGTIGTAKLLLSSKENLPNLSKEVGKNISFNGSVKAIALLPDSYPDADMYSGRSHPGLVSYHFLKKEHLMLTAAKVLPIQLVSGARFDTSMLGYPAWGKDYIQLIKQFRHRMIILAALGIEPTKGSMTVNDIGKINLHLNVNKELENHYHRTYKMLETVFKKTGCTSMPFEYVNRKGKVSHSPFFTSSHQLGSCRMSTSKENGVINDAGEVFNYPGMYIADGSAIPSSTIVNPSLTILANSELIADQLLLKYQKFSKKLLSVNS